MAPVSALRGQLGLNLHGICHREGGVLNCGFYREFHGNHVHGLWRENA